MLGSSLIRIPVLPIVWIIKTNLFFPFPFGCPNQFGNTPVLSAPFLPDSIPAAVFQLLDSEFLPPRKLHKSVQGGNEIEFTLFTA